jgi:hypothetical protein
VTYFEASIERFPWKRQEETKRTSSGFTARACSICGGEMALSPSPSVFSCRYHFIAAAYSLLYDLRNGKWAVSGRSSTQTMSHSIATTENRYILHRLIDQSETSSAHAEQQFSCLIQKLASRWSEARGTYFDAQQTRPITVIKGIKRAIVKVNFNAMKCLPNTMKMKISPSVQKLIRRDMVGL